MGKLNKIFKGLIYGLPAILFFSYYPIVSLGTSASMNFEFSLPLIWLVVFDVVGLALMIKQKLVFKDFKRKWIWLLFPLWLSLSVFWSLNSLRGFLTVGILWLIYLAIDEMWNLRKLFSEKFKRNFWRWFFGASLLACFWCVVQCVLDLAGVSRDYSLMCRGCTYQMFGFPHPNGFSIEPQFMGNLLLAPTIVAAWLMIEPKNRYDFKKSWPIFVCFLVTTATLFLTFSRGAVYALLVGLMFLSAFMIVRTKKERKSVVKKVGATWGLVVLSFLFTLNAQGLMAEMSPTNDTYYTGVAKVLNHLSLGVIEVRDGERSEKSYAPESIRTEYNREEKRQESSQEGVNEAHDSLPDESVFDGYVEESTDTRIKLTDSAMRVWSKDASTILFGVGVGGAGEALYVNHLTTTPKEIIQNQYASLLLETGVMGIVLLIFTIVLVIRRAFRNPVAVLLLTLMVVYGISVCFFSGLPNALHIYLLMGLFYCIFMRKKLVS